MGRNLATRIENLLRREIESLGYELVLAEYLTGGRATLRLYIDSPHGVTVDDCGAVSRQVAAVLAVEDPLPGDYALEVSSPGLDRPLVTPSHFARFRGEEVRLTLKRPQDGQRRFRGWIDAVDEDAVTVRVDTRSRRFAFDEIAAARLVPQYNL